jgi:hypothetical protein
VFHFSLLIGLTGDAKLVLMCSQTLLFVSLWDEDSVQDFIVLDGVSGVNEIDILLLTKPDESGKCYIQLASLPGINRIVLFSYQSKAVVHISDAMFRFSESKYMCVCMLILVDVLCAYAKCCLRIF